MADVVVIGGGLAGLTSALACADRGLEVVVVAREITGSASAASAGVLGPSIGRGPKGGRVGRFMFAARDHHPHYLGELEARTGIRVATAVGAIEVALNETHFDELRARGRKLAGSEVLGARDVAALEPALCPVAGALHHPLDGAVDVAALLDALRAALASHARVASIDASVVAVEPDGASPSVRLDDGSMHRAAHIVIAAGAWSSAIAGLPRLLPITPVKGEIAIVQGPSPVNCVIFGAGGYLVPRAGDLLVGATSSEAGFESATTSEATAELQATARTLIRGWPGERAPFLAQRAGLRPMTPDGYPILGRDPDLPSLIYACGYSRNGVLVSPLAAECVAGLALGEEPAFDLSAFSAARFRG